MPAVVLVLLILGTIALDAAVTYLGHRELADLAAGAADTAAAKALDRQAFYDQGGHLRIDPGGAQAVVDELRSSARGGGVDVTDASAAVSADGQRVTVVVRGTVHAVFGPAVGGHRTVVVTARATATIAEVRVRPG